MEIIETQREFWMRIAKDNGWYQSPFYVQVWMRRDGSVIDSVSYKGMTHDIVLIGE